MPKPDRRRCRVGSVSTLPLVLCVGAGCASSREPDGGPPPDPGEPSAGFVVEPNPRRADAAYEGFDRTVDANGLAIYGESGVSDEQLLYVAHIITELLDNDEDGSWDDPAVMAQLLAAEAVMPVFAREGSPAERSFFRYYRGDGASAVLYAGEVDPARPGHWGADATIEEVMHTINAVGHAEVYPGVFGLEPDSSVLTAAMDVARGGQFLRVPDRYPDGAWYHYDDRTCDYPCMAVEYIYWAQVSYLGILNDPQTCAGIADEWELCSPEQLASTDAAIHALLSDPARPMPQTAPDGDYAPALR